MLVVVLALFYDCTILFIYLSRLLVPYTVRFRTGKRVGLIQARLLGARAAQGATTQHLIIF